MSGWTAVTLHAETEEENEQLNENIEAEYGGNGRRPWTADGYADRTIQVERGADHEGVARMLADEFPLADRIIVVSANDTTDSGYGTLFDVGDGSVEEIDRKEGYEGAKGRDVTGYFREEYGVTGYATWEA